MLKKVLIVEDSPGWQQFYAKELAGKVEIIAAYDLKTSKAKFR